MAKDSIAVAYVITFGDRRALASPLIRYQLGELSGKLDSLPKGW